jgi:hypothetical protein
MRNHYWTIGPVADWIRGTKIPKAETSEGWNEWTSKAKAANPVRYWLAETGLDYLQKIVYYIPDQLYAAKYYINNRWVTRTHALTAHSRDIKPGTWSDVGNRFLPCLFNELVDFVEVELAWWQIAWSDHNEKAKYQAPFWSTGWWRWRTWRCKQAGLDNLAWQMTCDNRDYTPEDHPDYGKLTPQAHNAAEILALYKWWTEERPRRPDPMEASGWSAYCEANRIENGGRLSFGSSKNPKLKKMSDQAHKLLNKIEAKYEQEDEAMMIRLIKIRNSLWT